MGGLCIYFPLDIAQRSDKRSLSNKLPIPMMRARQWVAGGSKPAISMVINTLHENLEKLRVRTRKFKMIKVRTRSCVAPHNVMTGLPLLLLRKNACRLYEATKVLNIVVPLSRCDQYTDIESNRRRGTHVVQAHLVSLPQHRSAIFTGPV